MSILDQLPTFVGMDVSADGDVATLMFFRKDAGGVWFVLNEVHDPAEIARLLEADETVIRP